MNRYTGHCHCNAVTFEVDLQMDSSIVCNCSFCRRRGAFVSIVAHNQFSLTHGAAELNHYGNQPHASHHFCQTCGIHTFTKIDEPDGKKVAVNLACIDSIDLEALSPMRFNGKAL
jgi:hypothetical protein